MLSVATVVFNDPIGLKKTIDSVRYHKRQGADIEYLIADGGSDQATLDVIKHEGDIVDILLTGPDKGIYDGMNKLLDSASGNSIIFINSGDILNEKIDLVALLSTFEFDRKNHYGKVVQRYKSDCYMRPKTVPDEVVISDISHQAFFVPHITYKKVAFDLNYPVSSDREWIKRCLEVSDTVFIDEIISVFELGGISNSSNLKSLVTKQKEKISLTKKILQYTKFILKLFCTQSCYYRLIYCFKYKHFRCIEFGIR